MGILPAGFDFPRGAEWPAFFPFAGRTEVWLPLAFRAADDGTGWSNWQSRNERGLAVIGRLKPEVSLRQAKAEMDVYAARQAKDHPETHKGLNLRLISLREQLAGKSHQALLIRFSSPRSGCCCLSPAPTSPTSCLPGECHGNKRWPCAPPWAPGADA